MEVYHSAATSHGANNWGCEANASSKYVQKIATDANGVVSATITGISASVDGSLVTLIPLKTAATPATVPADVGGAIWGWYCGGTGTRVDLKYLPASCRGS